MSQSNYPIIKSWIAIKRISEAEFKFVIYTQLLPHHQYQDITQIVLLLEEITKSNKSK